MMGMRIIDNIVLSFVFIETFADMRGKELH